MEAGACDSFWCFATYVYTNGGVTTLILVAICFLFYKLIWKVWKSMIKSKDDEISRLTDERNFYQSLHFPDRMTSNVPRLEQQEQDDDLPD